MRIEDEAECLLFGSNSLSRLVLVLLLAKQAVLSQVTNIHDNYVTLCHRCAPFPGQLLPMATE